MLNQVKQTGTAAYEPESGNKANPLEALAASASRGDNSALYELCEKMAKSVLFRVRYMLGAETEPEEASRDVMLRVCENIKNLHEPKAFKAWLCCIAVNETRNYLVREKKTGVLVNFKDYIEENAESGQDAPLYEYTEGKTIHEAVMEMISHLPIRQREAVVLYYYDELSIAEAAWAMGVPQASVTAYLSAARQRVKREFERQPKASGMGAMAAMHMGALMSDALHAEAIHVAPGGAAWTQTTLAQCQQHINANTATLAGATTVILKGVAPIIKVKFSVAMAALTVVFAAGVLFLGIIKGGTLAADENGQLSEPLAISGKIDFSGGEYYRGTTRVNPKQATLQVESLNGGVSVQEWWITEAGSDTAIYKGAGEDTESALRLLRESGVNGEYNLFYRIMDETGCIYRLKGNFYIDEVP